MKKIKILHIASFKGNVGDNINHNGFRNRLSEFEEFEFEFTNIEMRDFYFNLRKRDFNSLEFIELCNSVDVVIIGGGGFFELKWTYSHTGTTIDISNDTLDKIKVPIIFNGVGCFVEMGMPDENIKKFEKFITKLQNREKTILSVRNDGSLQVVKNLFGNKFDDFIYEIPDGGFFCKIQDDKESSIIDKSRQYIGINLACDSKEIRFDEKNGITYEEFINKFANVVEKFLEEHKEFDVLFFPHIYSDMIAINDVLEKLTSEHSRMRVLIAPCISGDGLENEIIKLYSKCDLVMGMRFHTNVCAIGMNIPTIGLINYFKIESIYSNLDIADRGIRINKSDFNIELSTLMEDSIKDTKNIKYKYEKAVEKTYKDSALYYNEVYKILKEI